jgi:hypothetical protein
MLPSACVEGADYFAVLVAQAGTGDETGFERIMLAPELVGSERGFNVWFKSPASFFCEGCRVSALIRILTFIHLQKCTGSSGVN